MIPIFRGDDTNFNDALFLTINISATFDLSGFTAELVLGGGAVVKNTVLGENGAFEVAISAEESKLLPFGEVKGSVILVDKENRRRTIANDILFNVTNEVTEGLEYTADLSVTETEATVLNIKVGGGTGGGGTTDYNDLENKPSINGVALMNNVSLADIGAASSGDIAQSTQDILTAESENTTAILENAEENKSAILTNASENTSAIKANTDAKASEILTAVDESETAITSAVSAAQADIKADIAELKESGGGSSVSLDAAFMEVLSGLDKQKQILAQALNDKGANVTSADTLDKMAGAVKTLEVVGEKTNLKGTVIYGSNNSSSMFNNSNYSRALPLVLHRLYAYFNAKTKTFSILKFANDFTYEEMASVTLENDLINTSAYYNTIAIFSNEDETKIVLRTQSTTSSSYINYSFNVTYGDRITIEQIGSAVEFTTYSGQTAHAGAISPDGTKFFSFQRYYERAQVVDFIAGTSTEITFSCSDAYAYDGNGSDISYKVDENGLGVAVFGYGGTRAGYKMQFDFANNTVTFLGAVSFPSAKITNRNHNYSYSSYYIADKGLMVLLIGNNTTSSSYSLQERYYQSPVEFIVLNAKTGETVAQQVFKTCMRVSPDYGSTFPKDGGSYFYAKLDSGRFLVGSARAGVVEYDPETNQVFAYGTDIVLTDGDFIGSINSVRNDGLYYYNQTPIVSADASVLYGMTTSDNSSYNSFMLSSTYYRVVLYPQVVWGELYKRNGNEIVRTSFFEPSLYEAGAYAEKDSVAVVNVESGEVE